MMIRNEQAGRITKGLVSMLVIAVLLIAFTGVFAYFSSASTQVVAQVAEFDINRPTAVPDVTAEDALQSGLFLAFGVLGGISLIVIVLQGLRFVLSSGNAEKTAQARNGIIYSLVGLTIALAGSSLTQFVLKYFNPEDGQIEVVGANNLFVKIASLIALGIGIISVVMVVIAGIRYSLSSGNTETTNSARNTIIYAMIGLAIAIVAGPIISLVISLIT